MINDARCIHIQHPPFFSFLYKMTQHQVTLHSPADVVCTSPQPQEQKTQTKRSSHGKIPSFQNISTIYFKEYNFAAGSFRALWLKPPLTLSTGLLKRTTDH